MDCDKLVGSIVMARPHAKAKSGDPAKESERKISLMLQLRSVVKALPALRAALSGSSSSLLCTIAAAFDDERPEMMSDKIDKTIDDAAQGSLAKGPLAARNARAYAIKASARRMLEVARAAYLEAMADLVGRRQLDDRSRPRLSLPFYRNGQTTIRGARIPFFDHCVYRRAWIRLLYRSCRVGSQGGTERLYWHCQENKESSMQLARP